MQINQNFIHDIANESSILTPLQGKEEFTSDEEEYARPIVGKLNLQAFMEGDSDEDNPQEETANLKQSLNLEVIDARRASEQYREQIETHLASVEPPLRSSIDTSIKRGVTVGMVQEAEPVN